MRLRNAGVRLDDVRPDDVLGDYLPCVAAGLRPQCVEVQGFRVDASLDLAQVAAQQPDQFPTSWLGFNRPNDQRRLVRVVAGEQTQQEPLLDDGGLSLNPPTVDSG